jgi:hypothetical protein
MSSVNSLGGTLTAINQPLEAVFTSDPSNTPRENTLTSASTDQVDLSQAGTVFQQLEQLQPSNPAEFKKVATEAANQLSAAAQQTTDPLQASVLSNLAATFQKSADAGNLFPFQQQTQAAGTHHHHHTPAPITTAQPAQSGTVTTS